MTAVINDTGILVVLVAVVLLFGASRIPKLARNLGEASREFKNAQEHVHIESESPALPTRSDTVTVTRDQLDALLATAATHRGEPKPGQTGS